jgi:hypothetical protein
MRTTIGPMRTKRLFVLSAIVFAAVAGYFAASIPVQAADKADEAAIVDAMAQEPVHLASYCFPPSRANLAAARVACDEIAEARGYGQGFLRPWSQHDIDQGVPPAKCADFEASTNQWVCFGVAAQ